MRPIFRVLTVFLLVVVAAPIRDTHIGRLDKALTAAPKEGWIVVDMKKDWKSIFPFDK